MLQSQYHKFSHTGLKAMDYVTLCTRCTTLRASATKNCSMFDHLTKMRTGQIDMLFYSNDRGTDLNKAWQTALPSFVTIRRLLISMTLHILLNGCNRQKNRRGLLSILVESNLGCLAEGDILHGSSDPRRRTVQPDLEVRLRMHHSVRRILNAVPPSCSAHQGCHSQQHQRAHLRTHLQHSAATQEHQESAPLYHHVQPKTLIPHGTQILTRNQNRCSP